MDVTNDQDVNAMPEDLPPSSKLVYKVLEYEGPLTQKEIIDETQLGQRTVYDAIDRLENADSISTRLAMDQRQRVYRIARE